MLISGSISRLETTGRALCLLSPQKTSVNNSFRKEEPLWLAAKAQTQAHIRTRYDLSRKIRGYWHPSSSLHSGDRQGDEDSGLSRLTPSVTGVKPSPQARSTVAKRTSKRQKYTDCNVSIW